LKIAPLSPKQTCPPPAEFDPVLARKIAVVLKGMYRMACDQTARKQESYLDGYDFHEKA
jgi:hypothetical protein